MTRLNQTAGDQRQDPIILARLAALDLTQDDLVRPELRDEAILADRRRQHATHSRSGQIDSPRRPCATLC